MELRGCDLSTSVWLGLANIQTSLQGLTCIGSLEELHHLLAPYSRIVSLTGLRRLQIHKRLGLYGTLLLMSVTMYHARARAPQQSSA